MKATAEADELKLPKDRGPQKGPRLQPWADGILKIACAVGIAAYAAWLMVTTVNSLGVEVSAGPDVARGLLTFITTFLGAYFAFALQERQRKADERRRNVAAGNRALIMLLRQWNTPKQYQAEMIDLLRYQRTPLSDPTHAEVRVTR